MEETRDQHEQRIDAEQRHAKDAITSVPFTLGGVRKTIPKHCFRLSTTRSLLYFARDLGFIAAMYALRPLLFDSGLPLWMTIPLRVVWWNVTGFLFWCLFVVGHDCGHRTFSRSTLVCDVIGHLCHAPILVPFHGWRISHHKHHMFHNHIEKDETWKPYDKFFYNEFRTEPLAYLVRFTVACLWLFPIYMLRDTAISSGNHFWPWGRLFAPEERVGGAISSVSVVAFLSVLVYSFPGWWLLDAYFMPWLVFVAWLSLVTLLHHTHPDHGTYFREEFWSFFRGSLFTIDRQYFTPLVEHLHHDIGTHVVHHMFFTSIPHYHLREATEAVKPLLGDFYTFDTRNPLSVLMDVLRKCHFVAPTGDVLKYRTWMPEDSEQHRGLTADEFEKVERQRLFARSTESVGDNS